ncbi:helix-turn-helix domain-containing protein [Dyadobacter psychrophilus]|uniref:Helix-turn-helix domain-containing protein n=1 Tax=Dyadobacter psychrophilus TaxID=651661 RepID=A0A1T5B9N6_9BACT|nr:helix-turn-helix domain-containing protein [Dyadobacter psychrophilus]SKB43593.1 Helix-turn-helix domain-containing protein [Dyadobacter psychrophilus]
MAFALKAITGRATHQHIYLRTVEKAKEMVRSNSLATGNVAYTLGSERPTSFNKLFKQNTGMSPAAFRKSVNSK